MQAGAHYQFKFGDPQFPGLQGIETEGEPETVIIRDRLVVGVLSKLLSKFGLDEYLVGQTYRRATLFLKTVLRITASSIQGLRPIVFVEAVLPGTSACLGRTTAQRATGDGPQSAPPASTSAVQSLSLLLAVCRGGVCCVWRMERLCSSII